MMSVPVIWFIVGVGCMLLELLSPLFIIFFFGLGAWAAAFAMYLGASLAMSFGVFSVVSIASLLILRRVLIKTLHGSKHMAKDVPTQSSLYVGKQAVVSQAILSGGIGEISLGGSYWRAVLDVDTTFADDATATFTDDATATFTDDATATLAHDVHTSSAKGLEIGRTVVVVGHDPDDAILLRVRPL